MLNSARQRPEPASDPLQMEVTLRGVIADPDERWLRVIQATVEAERQRANRRRAVLFAGQAYYNAWYASRALRSLGWRADVLNWDSNINNDSMFYHGHDFRFQYGVAATVYEQLSFYANALTTYDVIHFSNMQGISFGWLLDAWFARHMGPHAGIYALKDARKKIVYSNNGCHDGVSQTAFSKWGSEPICNICPWKQRPDICSDERNLAWGKFRNEVADFQCTSGGNRADYNDDPAVHEVPEFYCLDPEVWSPALEIPEQHRLPRRDGLVRLFHGVGNYADRTDSTGVNIKSTHIYRAVVERLRADGHDVELVLLTNVPNKELRFYQAQCDIFVDMLTFGFFGATGREGMMLGKPVVCYLRPEWLESMRAEIPEYVRELPVVNATPDTVYDLLKELVAREDKRQLVGRRSREFALRWHSAEAAGRRLDSIYGDLLGTPVA
jgi:glycosyltransferase involved in cell wall biosynthesis